MNLKVFLCKKNSLIIICKIILFDYNSSYVEEIMAENEKIFTYLRKVNYYETDKMQFTHHSNYVKFMEEARINFLEEIGYGYDKLETMGIISPVVSICINYKSPTTFNDKLEIQLYLSKYDGVKFEFTYKMINSLTKKVVLEASSSHCFISSKGLPIIIKKQYKEIDEVLNRYLCN